MVGSWNRGGSQCIQLVGVLHCKPPANGIQLPVFPILGRAGFKPPISELGDECVPAGHCVSLSVFKVKGKTLLFIMFTVSVSKAKQISIGN